MASIADRLAALGIKPLNGERFSPLSEDEVARIETSLGVSLTESYKQFLLQFGRSMFTSEVNCTPSAGPLYFGWFYGFSELLTAIDGLRETLPETIIPIGDDSGDVVFCLGVRGEDVGKVYIHNNGWGWHADAERYLERGEPVPPDIRYQTVEQIASSFEEFILNMKREEEAS
jgi:hypothetical protein